MSAAMALIQTVGGWAVVVFAAVGLLVFVLTVGVTLVGCALWCVQKWASTLRDCWLATLGIWGLCGHTDVPRRALWKVIDERMNELPFRVALRGRLERFRDTDGDAS